MRIALPELLRPYVEGATRTAGEIVWYESGSDAADAASDCDVLYVHFWSREQIAAAIEAGKGLRWVATTAAGVDFLPLAAMRERGIVLTSGAGLPTIPVSEFAVMCVLSAAKNLPALVRAHDRHEWVQAPGRAELFESRALIVGYGAIGRAIAERLRAFDVAVTGVRTEGRDEAGVIGAGEWRARLGEFDWVILAAAATPQTQGMIGVPELAAMRRSAYLINIARGALVDEVALAEALHDGQIAGAYLDVNVREPLPADHPLWSAPGAIVTAHSSGAATTRMAERAAALFLENLGRYARGEALRNALDLERGY